MNRRRRNTHTSRWWRRNVVCKRPLPRVIGHLIVTILQYPLRLSEVVHFFLKLRNVRRHVGHAIHHGIIVMTMSTFLIRKPVRLIQLCRYTDVQPPSTASKRLRLNQNPSSVTEPVVAGLSGGIEGRLLVSLAEGRRAVEEEEEEEDVGGTEGEDGELDAWIWLCEGEDEDEDNAGREDGLEGSVAVVVECPLCERDITEMSDESRQVHTNACLDESVLVDEDPSLGDSTSEIVANDVEKTNAVPQEVVECESPVLQWLRSLDLAKYEDVFVKEEIDWDTLPWLTDEDLVGIGITALGPRKKILHALAELRKGDDHSSHMRI
ncbi:hypothetical protein Droror1_Dr00016444 [Drosera rotundifolia]